MERIDAMPIEEKAWEEMVKNILRAEMMRRGVSYAGLADRLGEYGIEDNELNLRNKVSRGRFTAVFFMQCMQALGVEFLQIPHAVEEAAKKGAAQKLARKPSQSNE
ncbi:DUF6471 domain-containing protein [Qipengyuania citrea]|uniref:DUF6471 domain-containing protein n=2 Tax=Qipengyuania citrea TaxID=225971 RepID=A0ABU0NBS1_9SPHN|nr:DUF6471 domain-containing protein [Qipengyuania citrea]MDQ0566858.1 hypothetical protein [Qipengyuania citrea]